MRIKPIHFLVRQLTRFQLGVSKFSAIFQVSNFVSLILLLLTNVGVSIRLRWIALIYVGIIIIGLSIVLVIEKLGGWHTDTRQIFDMKERTLYDLKIKLQSYYIALAIKMPKEELLEQIEKLQNNLYEKKKEQ